jgi:hypothetical protein
MKPNTRAKFAAFAVSCWFAGLYWEPFDAIGWSLASLIALALVFSIDKDLGGMC